MLHEHTDTCYTSTQIHFSVTTYFSGHLGLSSLHNCLLSIHPNPGKKSVRYSFSKHVYIHTHKYTYIRTQTHRCRKVMSRESVIQVLRTPNKRMLIWIIYRPHPLSHNTILYYRNISLI